MASTTEPNADIPSRVRNALYGGAVCDALGGPLEFKPRRQHPAQYLRDMIPNHNFGLLEGHYTDDTSMTLCLAASLTETARSSLQQAEQQGSLDSAFIFHDPVDQASRYVRWLRDGYMSSVSGPAFDVGIQTRQVLHYWSIRPRLATLDTVKEKFDFERNGGNGSLMRVLPTALVARTEEEAMELARRSSEVTHPHVTCLDICAMYAVMVFWALRGDEKEQLVERLRGIVSSVEIYDKVKARLEPYKNLQDWKDKERNQISSSGYVLDSLEAALWAFFGTDSFEDGAIEVVNLGDDADTVGAIYGGLAGAFYGSKDCIPERWLNSMKGFSKVEKVADGLVETIAAIGPVA